MSRKLDTSLHKTVRIYEHGHRHGPFSHVAYPDCSPVWRGGIQRRLREGQRIVAVGSEGGAMAVHLAPK